MFEAKAHNLVLNLAERTKSRYVNPVIRRDKLRNLLIFKILGKFTRLTFCKSINTPPHIFFMFEQISVKN